MNYELWSQLQQFAPGAYKILYRRLFFRSRSEKLQAQNIIKKLKPLPTQPQMGVAWFPVVNDKTVPIGVLGQIHAGFDQPIGMLSSQYRNEKQKELRSIPILEEWFL